MSLTGWVGEKRVVDKAIIRYALDNLPCLILDCANSADPFSFIEDFDAEKFDKAYVIPIDLLYVFRDAVLKLPSLASSVNCNTIIITSAYALFNYGDIQENDEIYLQVWEVLRRLSSQFNIHIALRNKDSQLKRAKHFCSDMVEVNMGHTVSSQRQVVDRLLSEIKSFRSALRGEDVILFEKALKKPLRYLGAISNASSLHTWAFLLLAIIIDQERRLERVERINQKN